MKYILHSEWYILYCFISTKIKSSFYFFPQKHNCGHIKGWKGWNFFKKNYLFSDPLTGFNCSFVLVFSAWWCMCCIIVGFIHASISHWSHLSIVMGLAIEAMLPVSPKLTIKQNCQQGFCIYWQLGGPGLQGFCCHNWM